MRSTPGGSVVPCDQMQDRQNVSDPFFSPDGRSIGFCCGNLYTVSLSGGRRRPLYESILP
jgi:hypothetical protein